MKLIRTLKRIMASSYDRKGSRMLHSMTDRELQDIGICRGDINRMCRTQAEFDRKTQL
jgi:uncharacterized protein YjiS (DUF1127 family)